MNKPEAAPQPPTESGSEDEEDDDEFVAASETDSDRRRMMADTMEEAELNMTSLRNQSRLPEFWHSGRAVGTKDTKETKNKDATVSASASRPRTSGSTSTLRPPGKTSAILIEISDSEDDDSDSEDAQELLKKLGLSVNEETELIPAGEEPPLENNITDMDKGKRSSCLSTMGPGNAHESNRRQAETPIESGGWCCELCT